MKKIFYILASAIVALGAVACENDGLDNIGLEVNGDTVSFIASIDNNRTALDGLNTIWDTDDTIQIEWNETTYNFKNSAEEPNKFSCTEEGLSGIVNANITATYSHNNDGNIDSNAGTAGALLTYTGSFTELRDGEKGFAVQNAFLKFTAEEGVVITASEGLFDEKTDKTFEVTKENAGEIYVAVNAGVPATLSYRVGENEGKNLSTTFEKGVIYNLGSLTKAVAKDDKGKFYTSLADAFKLAENGATISLLGDIVLESGVTVAAGKEYTLDLAGKTLSLVSNVMGGYLIQNNGVLTIGNGTVDYTYNGEADNTYGKGNYVITNRGTLTIESDATIINKTDSMAHANYAIDNISVSADTALTVKGTVSFENGTAIRQCTSGKANSLNVEDGATIVAKTYGIQIFLSTSDATVAPEVDLTITGGTISGEYAITSVSMGNSFENVNITIEGGVLNGDVAFTTFYNEENHSVETVTISGGEFNMKKYGLYSYGLWFDDATLVESINITGGTYNMAPENAYYGNLLAEGYAAKNNGNGTYTVAKVTYVAQVGETMYENINDAIANADGSTVELLADVEGTVTLDKACTINTNGFAFEYTVANDFKATEADNTITVEARVYVAQVGSTKYELWAEAYAAGTEITLLADVEGTVTLDKACTINNPNGFAFNYTVANDFKATVNDNGNIITVVARVYVAKVGETNYEVLNDAIDDAKGATVTLLANVTGVNKECVVKPGSYTLETADGWGKIDNGDGTYTVKALPKVFVCISDVNWSKVNIHITNSKGDVTTWPGKAMTKVATAINGKTYYEYTMPDFDTYGFTFNSGGGSNSYWKLEIKGVKMDVDKYFRLSARGPIEVDPNDVKTFGYTIYVFDQKSKNVAPNLYVWGDNNAFKNTYGTWNYNWSGQVFANDCYYQPADGNNWEHYYYCEIPTSLYNTGFNFIVNKSGQTGDCKPTNITSDLYVGYWFDSENSNGFWTNKNMSTPITK